MLITFFTNSGIPGTTHIGMIQRIDWLIPMISNCHLRKPSRKPASIFALSFAVEALAGSWQVFVRAGVGEDADRTAELAVIHADGVDVVAAEEIVTIGVDAGMAGVFDRTCPEPAQTELHVEGVVHGLGAFAFSGHGDGLYPVFVGKALGRVAKLCDPRVSTSRPSSRSVTTRRSPASSTPHS